MVLAAGLLLAAVLLALGYYAAPGQHRAAHHPVGPAASISHAPADASAAPQPSQGLDGPDLSDQSLANYGRGNRAAAMASLTTASTTPAPPAKALAVRVIATRALRAAPTSRLVPRSALVRQRRLTTT
jgi:hypothetical protein